MIPKVELTHARSRVSAEHDGCLVDASSLVYVTVKGDTEKALLLDISFPTTEGKLSSEYTKIQDIQLDNIHISNKPEHNILIIFLAAFFLKRSMCWRDIMFPSCTSFRPSVCLSIAI